MRALIVDSDKERRESIRSFLDEAGTDVQLVDTWSRASELITSNKPDVCVVAFQELVGDGLDSLLAADAQLKVLKIPSLVIHTSGEASEVDSVRPLANFADTVEVPRELDAIPERLNQIISGIAGGEEPSEPGLAEAFEAARRWDDPAMLEPGTLVDGRYEIAEFVAAGGMGYIYKALQQPLERPVALKVIRGELSQDDDAIARFRLEARTVSRLTHPHTIVLFDYGIDAHGLMYLAMEWLEGDTLADYFDVGRTFSPVDAARIARQTAESLSEAHRKGIVHRDLKPGNIFLVNDQAEPNFVKVLDFGIAKLMDNSTAAGITRVGTICGTPEYMSPEQARGEDLDGRSDIYALGCCLHAMLTGDPPFLDDQPLQVIMRHQNEPLPHPGDDVPEALIAIIERATAKDVDERYEDATTFAAALDAFLENPEEVPAWGAVDTGAKTLLPDHVLSGDSKPPQAAEKEDEEPERPQNRLLRVPELDSGLLGDDSLIRILHLLGFQEKTGELRVRRRGQSRVLHLVSGLVCRKDVQAFLPAFDWREGEWSFRETEPEPGGTVEALQVIHDGLRLHGSVNELAMQLADNNDLYAVRTSLYEQNRVQWDALGRVAEVFALCNGDTQVASLMTSGVEFQVVTRALILGEHTDAIAFLEEPVSAPLPVSYAVARSETRTLTLAARETLQKLQGAIDELQSSDAYAALGLSSGCGEAAVKDRFKGLEERYSKTDVDAAVVVRKKSELMDALRSTRDKLLEQERESAKLTGEEERVLEELDVKRAQFAGSDPYAAFGLWPGCGRNAIEDRFFELVNRHHPDQYANYGREEIKTAADEVFIELQKVYRLLLGREKTEEPSREKPGSSTSSRQAGSRPDTSTASRGKSSSTPGGFARSRQSSTSVSKSGSATRVKVRLPTRPVTQTSTKQPTTRSADNDVGKRGTSSSASRRNKRVAPSAPPKRAGTSTRVPSTNEGQPFRSEPSRERPSNVTNAGRPRRQRRMSEILAERARKEDDQQEPAESTTTKDASSEAERKPTVEPVRSRRSRPDLSALRAARTPGEHARQGARFLEQNNLEAARRAYEAARELDPDDYSHAAHLAWIDYLCDPQQVSQVVDRLKGMRKKRGGREANYYLGKISFREGELSSARRFYETTLRDHEGHVGARRELRLVKMRLDEEKEEKSTGLFNRLVKKVKSKLE